jgi:hypothetical protein
MSDESGEREAPQDVKDILQRIDASWRELMAALDGIPEERLEEPGAVGDWSLKNLLGHLAFWDEEAVREFEQALAGLPRSDNDWQTMNEADHAARVDRTLPEERTAMHRAHATLLERLEDVAGIEAARIDEAVRGGSYEHYQEHVPDIREWRQRVGV